MPHLQQDQEAKLKALREAAKQRFDEIDQGKCIGLKSKKAIGRYATEFGAEASVKAAKNGK